MSSDRIRIVGAVEARLLGRRVLTLQADIAVAPEAVRPVRSRGARGAAESPAHNGGAGLAAAARAIAAGERELRSARDRMP